MSNNQPNSFFLEKSRELRKNLSPIEKILWNKLNHKQLGAKFRRQYPIKNQYIVDFICLEKKLIIELDGEEHLESLKDKTRDKFLKENGFEIIRFWNYEICNNLETCLRIIYSKITTPPS